MKQSSYSFRAGSLVLSTGEVYEGQFFGSTKAVDPCAGEVVFNTVMSGYQEVLTDPSYAGQIVTFTYPHIGNYGVTHSDMESDAMVARGAIVRELSDFASSWRSEDTLGSFLESQGRWILSEVDTRRLTKSLRTYGALTGAFGPTEGSGAFTKADLEKTAKDEPGTDGIDLVAQVSTRKPYVAGSGPLEVVAYDFGIKQSIVKRLAQLAKVTVVPASTPAAEVIAMNPDGVFLSNGPGDPNQVPYAIEAVRHLLGTMPMFGICLGHQILALALGAKVKKLSFGHHGGNHPLKNLASGSIEITSQNHNFAVDLDSLPTGVEMTHVNLNDGVCEGLSSQSHGAFSVQHHPEASPGPTDSDYLFKQFFEMMETNG